MKARIPLLLCPAVLGLSMAAALAQPLARVTISNFAGLSNGVVRVANAASPGSQDNLGANLTGKLGLVDLSTFDSKGTWEFAIWNPGNSPLPLMALKCPAPDVKKFRAKLREGSLMAKGKEWTQLSKGVSAIVFKAADELTDAEKAELKRWEDEPLVAPKRMVQLTLAPSEELRAQILPFLGTAKMSMSQGVAAAAAGSNVNPKALRELFDVYFDGIEAFIKGFQDLKLSLDVTSDAIMVDETITAKPGSAFAAWIHKPTNPITTEDLNAVMPNALFSFAATVGDEPQLTDLMRKVIRLSMEMQNQATNDTIGTELADVVAVTLPARFSGSVFLKDHLEFAGVYRFPKSDAAAVYGKMKPVMAKLVKTQAGEGKIYSEASFTEKHHTIAGVPVDRYSFTMNLDNPAFQLPGQKEQIQKMFPNGKMECEYALKGDRLLVATPEHMQDLIEGKVTAQSGSAIIPTDSMVAAGYFNLLTLVRDFAGSNPMIPQMAKDRISKLDPSGTAVQFQLEINSQIGIATRTPLKLIEQLGKMK